MTKRLEEEAQDWLDKYVSGHRFDAGFPPMALPLDPLKSLLATAEALGRADGREQAANACDAIAKGLAFRASDERTAKGCADAIRAYKEEES